MSVDPGWPPWCERCDWGLTIDGLPTGRYARWRRTRMDSALRARHRKLVETSSPRRDRTRWLAVGVAIGVHLVPVVLLVGAAWLWTTSALLAAKIVATLIALGISWVVRPRLGRVPAGAVTRTEAPGAFGLFDAVADHVDARRADRLVVTSEYNASFGRYGWRGTRVLSVGLPLWNVLTDAERVALLAHEFAHEVNGDSRNGPVISSALTSLHEWRRLLRPSNTLAHRRRRSTHGGLGSTIVLGELLTPVVLLPLFLTVSGLSGALDRLTASSGQRAEYLADLMSARTAGTDAAVSLLRKAEFGSGCVFAMNVALRADPRSDVWRIGREYVENLPAHEQRRLERAAEKSLHRTDASHPPTVLRVDNLVRRPSLQRALAVDRATMASAHTDIVDREEPVLVTLRDRAKR